MNLQEVYKQAIENNLCREWQGKMRADLSLKNLCNMYFDGDDWSMEKDFPNLETLRQFKGKSEVYGIFTDYLGMPNNLPRAAFFGNSDVKIIYNGFSVSQVVLRHETKAKITAAENSIIIINILDNAEVDIECIENAKVSVFQYGGTFHSSGEVKIYKSSFKK